MSFKRAAVLAAALAIALPVSAYAQNTGTRIDREERKAPEEKEVWYYVAGAGQVGPLTDTELVDAAEEGAIKADTQVYHPDAGWRVASLVPELSGIVN